MNTAEYWIEQLELEAHPEGGFFRETYRSDDLITAGAVSERFGGARNVSTAIYFLLQANSFSSFHRIRSDEMWHFYRGLPLHIHMIDGEGAYQLAKLGANPDEGEMYQCVVPAETWFAAEPVGQAGYSLLGCTVAPGFDFADFELALRAPLTALFPQHSNIIARLTRQ